MSVLIVRTFLCLVTVSALMNAAIASVMSNEKTIYVAERQLVGDAETLSTIRQLSIAGHEVMINRWRSQRNIDEVMQQLAMQLPRDTVAWGETGNIYMHWKSETSSHYLTIMPLSENLVELVVSSLSLQVRKTVDAFAEKQQFAGDAYDEIKRVIRDKAFDAEKLIDVKDHSDEAQGYTLLYGSPRSVMQIDRELRRRLQHEGWQIPLKDPTLKPPNASLTIDAYRYPHFVRIVILAAFGKSFLHIHQSGSLAP